MRKAVFILIGLVIASLYSSKMNGTQYELKVADPMIAGRIPKGPWKDPFDSKLTGSSPFLVSNNILRNVLTMHQTHVVSYDEDSDSQIVALTLQRQDDQAGIALIIFLPKDSKFKEIFNFYYSQKQSNREVFLNCTNKFQETKVDLFIPKFSFNKRSLLKNFFMSIGIRDAFTTAFDKAPTKSFIANHPFFYCIADLRTKPLLFMEVLNAPFLSLNPGKYK